MWSVVCTLTASYNTDFFFFKRTETLGGSARGFPSYQLAFHSSTNVMWSLQNIIREMSGRKFKVTHIPCSCLSHTVLFPTTVQSSFSLLHVSVT